MSRRQGRPWRRLLCPEKGVAVDEKATLAAFEKRYREKHMEREGEQG